ncbi:MAG TPA: hypothetical protein P5277_04050 [Candidatus Paceibacterota bacterium]|nr:hypothetical protein [Candidatus Paceibacterota bacterium]
MIDREYLEEKIFEITKKYNFTAEMLRLTKVNQKNDLIDPIDTRGILSMYKGLCEMRVILEVYKELYPNNPEIIKGIQISNELLSDIEDKFVEQIHSI